MIITKAMVLKIYESVLSKEISYDEADRWAYSMMEHYDYQNLQFEPEQDESIIWDLIMFLYGIDMPDIETRQPARGDLDIIDFLKEKGVDLRLT